MRFVWVVLFCMFSLRPAFAAEPQVVAGAGPSTKVVELFFDNFSKLPAASGYDFKVPYVSAKHKGGIENSETFLFGRTGRPLSSEELALGKGEIFLAMVPIVFVAGDGVTVQSLSLRELEMIYRKQITNWKRLEGPDAPILTIGREPTEALFSELKNGYYFFRNVSFDKTLYRDHEVTSFLRTPEGRYAIAFGAEPNFYGMNLIFIKEDLQAGVRVGLVYDLKNQDHPVVQAAREYAASDEWKEILKSSKIGLHPIR